MVVDLEQLRRLLRRLAAGRLHLAPISSGRMAAVLLPPGQGAKREAVLLLHEVCDMVSWRSYRPKWCHPR